MDTVRIDMDQLARYIQWKMDQENLSLRDAAIKSKVSAATLSRILKKGANRPQPDVETLFKLMRWVEVPLEKIVDAGQTKKHIASHEKSTPEAIEVHLRADRNLSAEAAEAIAKMVRVAYAEFTKRALRSHS